MSNNLAALLNSDMAPIRLIHESAISRGCLVVGPILGSGM